MSFKEEYNDLQKNIVPDAEFLDKLAQKMEQAQSEQKKQKQRKSKMPLFISAGAVCVSAAAALLIIINLPNSRHTNINNTTDNIAANTNGDKVSYSTGIFDNGKIFSDDKPIPEQLSQILEDSETVLYENSENKFEYSDKLSDKQRLNVAAQIRNAAETEKQLGDNIKYYMAVTKNGDVFKFRISGDILEIDEKIFKATPHN